MWEDQDVVMAAVYRPMHIARHSIIIANNYTILEHYLPACCQVKDKVHGCMHEENIRKSCYVALLLIYIIKHLRLEFLLTEASWICR